jgi:hypothetical protein
LRASRTDRSRDQSRKEDLSAGRSAFTRASEEVWPAMNG